MCGRPASPGEDATYADNVAKLLAELEGARAPKRTARFRTVALVRWPDGREVIADGVVEGRIAEAPRGDDGFGYDPVFMPDAAEAAGRHVRRVDPGREARHQPPRPAFRALAAVLDPPA